MNKGVDVYLKHYDNLLILGDLNLETKDSCLNAFSNVNNLTSLNKEPTCLKNPNNPSCINLLLTNRSRYFQNTSTTETGISDFYKLVVTVLKMFYKKQKLKIIQYRNYKTFNEQLFRIELDKELAKIDLNNVELAEFHNKFLSVLNKHAPIKYKYIRGNNSSFMNKSLRKEILLCSRLCNKFLKTKTKESKHLYNKQRNFCVTLLRKTKRNYFAELDNRILKDNRKFWKTVNPLFLEKAYQKESIAIISKDTEETITKNEELAETFNSFFSSMVDNLKTECDIYKQANVSAYDTGDRNIQISP